MWVQKGARYSGPNLGSKSDCRESNRIQDTIVPVFCGSYQGL